MKSIFLLVSVFSMSFLAQAQVNFDRVARAVAMASISRDIDFQIEDYLIHQIKGDLEVIFANRLGAEGQIKFGYFSHYEEGTLLATLQPSVLSTLLSTMGSNDELVMPATTGTPALDSLLQANGVTKIQRGSFPHVFVYFKIPENINHYNVAKAIAANSSALINRIEVNGMWGSGPTIHYVNGLGNGSVGSYVFEYGMGDCPSGCTEFRRAYIEAARTYVDDEVQTVSASIIGESGDPIPEEEGTIFIP